MPDEVDTVDQVITRMREIGEEAAKLGAADGVACFNRLYLAVTEAVKQELDTPNGFKDWKFTDRLDIHFAKLYFNAVRDWNAEELTAKAWQPLFEQRGDRNISPIQFALTGMNAHINHNLSQALVITWEEIGKRDWRVDGHESAAWVDFQRVNEILETVRDRVEKELKNEFHLQWWDRAVGQVDEIVEMWSVEKARDLAWAAAELRWDVREHEGTAGAVEDIIDRLVGFAGHQLLRRIGSFVDDQGDAEPS
ncbi:MAG: DUF5995 family protein [Thermoleophilaceae bacterium]|jgi:hypothetical protein